MSGTPSIILLALLCYKDCSVAAFDFFASQIHVYKLNFLFLNMPIDLFFWQIFYMSIFKKIPREPKIQPAVIWPHILSLMTPNRLWSRSLFSEAVRIAPPSDKEMNDLRLRWNCCMLTFIMLAGVTLLVIPNYTTICIHYILSIFRHKIEYLNLSVINGTTIMN